MTGSAGTASPRAFGDSNLKPADLKRPRARSQPAWRSWKAPHRGIRSPSPVTVRCSGPSGRTPSMPVRRAAQPAATRAATPAIGTSCPFSSLRRSGAAVKGTFTCRGSARSSGPFAGIFGAIGGGARGAGRSRPRRAGGRSCAAGLRLGFGAESLTGSPGTATTFLEGGIRWRRRRPQNVKAPVASSSAPRTCFPSAPARTGLRLGLRLPFWLFPGTCSCSGSDAWRWSSPSALSDRGRRRSERRFHPVRARAEGLSLAVELKPTLRTTPRRTRSRTSRPGSSTRTTERAPTSPPTARSSSRAGGRTSASTTSRRSSPTRSCREPFFRSSSGRSSIAASSVFIWFVLGLFLAIALEQARPALQRIYRSLLVIPYAIPGLPVAARLGRPAERRLRGDQRDLSGSTSPGSSTLWAKVSVHPRQRLARLPVHVPRLARRAPGDPDELTEAARVDGREQLQVFRRVTLPLLLVASPRC